MAAANTINTLDENILEEHNEDVDPDVAIILGAVGIAVTAIGFILLCCFACWLDDNSGVSFWTFCWVPLWVCGLLFVACCLAVAYGRQLDKRDQQDYQGKMRITSFRLKDRLERHTSQSCTGTGEDRRCTSSTTYERYYDAILTLDWGYGWACPDQALEDVQCDNAEVVYDKKLICRSSGCSSKAYQSARERIEASVLRVYNQSANYTPYDPHLGPSGDVDWPNLVAFGDCSTCVASLTVSSISTLEGLRNASISLAAVAIGVPLLVAACFGFRWCVSDRPTRSEQGRATARPEELEQWRDMRRQASVAVATTNINDTITNDLNKGLKTTTFVVETHHLVELPLSAGAFGARMITVDLDDGDDSDNDNSEKDKEDTKKADIATSALTERNADKEEFLSAREDLHAMLSDAQEHPEEKIEVEPGDDDDEDDDEGLPVSSRPGEQRQIEYESSRRALDRTVLELPVPDQRQVPCVCAICLSTYKTGEQVSWSPTYLSSLKRGCPHAFHTSCLESHARATAERQGSSATVLCPLCRQPFVG